MNVAAGAKPIEESVRETKILESERPQFTRQSCVVTNTSVLHVTPAPKDASKSHGILSGLAPSKPPPLLTITGTQPSRSERGSDPGTQPSRSERGSDPTSVGARGVEFRDIQESPRVMNPREIATPRETNTQKIMTPQEIVSSLEAKLSRSPKGQHLPPLVRDVLPVEIKPTPPSRNISGRPKQDVLPCGCKNSEPCRHQLYSQEVPYVSPLKQARVENSTLGPTLPLQEGELSSRNTIFRPWTEIVVNESAKSSSPTNTLSPSVQLKHSAVSQQTYERLTGSPQQMIRTPPSGVLTPAVLMNHPRSQELVEISQLSDTRSPHPMDDPLLHSIPQDRGPRHFRSYGTSQGDALHPLSSTTHIQMLPDPSAALHPRPHVGSPNSRSPLPQQLRNARQPNDRQNLNETSIISSPQSGVRASSTLSPFFHQNHSTARRSQTAQGIPCYPPSSTPRPLPNQPTFQEGRGPTLIQSKECQPTAFPPQRTSQRGQVHPDPCRSNSRLTPPFEHSQPSTEGSVALDTQPILSENSRAFSEQRRALQEHYPTVSENYSSALEPSSIANKPSIVSDPSLTLLTSVNPTESQLGLQQQQPPQSQLSIPEGQATNAGDDTEEQQKSPFIKRVELHQPQLESPVDIQRYVNPSYMAKTACRQDEMAKGPVDNQGMFDTMVHA